MMDAGSRIFVTEPDSLTGRAIMATLKKRGHRNLLASGPAGPDLRDPVQVGSFFEREKPEFVFLGAGRSTGIEGNRRRPAELMLDNLLVACHVMDAARRHGVRKLLYLASSCCYPADCPQPMKEESLMAGRLERTSEAYAMAKMAGITLCQAYRAQFGANFIAAIPADTFGTGDDFDPEESHVVAGLIGRFEAARRSGQHVVEVWGSGRPVRDLLFVEDLAEACVLLMERYEGGAPVNIGSGRRTSIRELAEMVRDIVHPEARIAFDASRPDGVAEKVLDTTRIRALGWTPRADLSESLALTYRWFRKSGEAAWRGPGVRK